MLGTLSQFSEDVNKIIVCGGKYINHEDGCCLDDNSNEICDDDETVEENPHTPDEDVNVCNPRECDSNQCGTINDECDGTINCGSCDDGYGCDNHLCVEEEVVDDCDPIDCDSNQCGTIDNGCDSYTDCGDCSSGYECDDHLCVEEEIVDVCDPRECDSNQCGTIDDDCDGTINCGNCDSGYECDNNVCTEEEQYVPTSNDFDLSITPSKNSYTIEETVSGEYHIVYGGENFEGVEVKCFSRSGYNVNFCHKTDNEYISNHQTNENLRAFELYGNSNDPFYTWPLDYFNATGIYDYWIGIYLRSGVEEQLEGEDIHWSDLPERIAELTPIVSAETSVNVVE